MKYVLPLLAALSMALLASQAVAEGSNPSSPAEKRATAKLNLDGLAKTKAAWAPYIQYIQTYGLDRVRAWDKYNEDLRQYNLKYGRS